MVRTFSIYNKPLAADASRKIGRSWLFSGSDNEQNTVEDGYIHVRWLTLQVILLLEQNTGFPSIIRQGVILGPIIELGTAVKGAVWSRNENFVSHRILDAESNGGGPRTVR